jgi:hypothetical protein
MQGTKKNVFSAKRHKRRKHMKHIFTNTWRRSSRKEGRKQKRALPFFTNKADTPPVEHPTMPEDMAKKIWKALLLYAGGEHYNEFITLEEVSKAKPLLSSKPGHPVYLFRHENLKIMIRFWNDEPYAQVVA